MTFISGNGNVQNKNLDLLKTGSETEAAKNSGIEFLFDGTSVETVPKTKQEILDKKKRNDQTKLNYMDRMKFYTEGLKGKTTNVQLNYEAFKNAGAKNITGLAFSALNKSNMVVKGANAKIQGFFSKLIKLNTSDDMDPEKVQEKSKTIEKKIEALIKEANAKLQLLSDISDSLFKVHKLTLEMGIFNMQTHDILDFMNKMISGIDEGTDDFSDIEKEISEEESLPEGASTATTKTTENKELKDLLEAEDEDKLDEKLNEKIYETMNNILGPNTTEELENKKLEIADKINELTEKLQKNDFDETEEFARQKTEIELNMYVFEFKTLDFIIGKIQEFAPKE